MDKLNLIEFDEVELIRDENAASATATAYTAAAAVAVALVVDDDDDDETLLIVDSQQQPPLQAAFNASVLPPSSAVELDDVIDDDNGADDLSDDVPSVPADPVVLPPASDILPPSNAGGQVRRLPRLDADGQCPPPEVNTGEDEVVSRRFCRRMSLGLGVSQLVVGMVAMCLGVVSIALTINFSFVGHGIWAGSMCLVAGFLGMIAYRKVTAMRVLLYMIVSIMATCCAAAMFGVAVAACLRKSPRENDHHPFSYFQFSASLGINLLMSIISMLAMTLTITSWIIACRASFNCGTCLCVCCRDRTSANVQLSDAYYYRSQADPSTVVCDFTQYSEPPAYTPSIPPPAYAETLPENHSRQK